MRKLIEEYLEIAGSFLQNGAEDDLYRISMLSKEFIRADLGPHELVQAHLTALERALDQHESHRHADLARRLSALLLEAIVAYAENHRHVRQLITDLRRSRDELAERTAQLVQTEKMTALGEMVASVSHEVNQPLNAIVIICEDLLRDIQKKRLQPEGVETDLREVVTQVRKLAAIVDHLRVFARPTTGTRRETFDLNLPIEGVFKLLGQQLRVHGIQVTQELATGLVITGDLIRLEQVLMNLLVNARDAVDRNDRERGKRILVRTLAWPGPPPDTYLAVEIRDNGDGMSPEVQEKLFQPFFTTKEPGRGTGLGLTVVHQIVEEHGGRIEVESTEGEGTVFRVLLPAGPTR